MITQRYFRWPIVVVILVVLALIYAMTAPLDVFLAREATQRGDLRMARILYSGAFWNTIVAILCVTAWQFMRRRARVSMVTGAYAVAAALVIVMRTWVIGLFRGQNPFPLIEAVLTWLPMLYVIIFALRESKQESLA